VFRYLTAAASALAILGSSAVFAAEPQPWQLGLPEPVTPLAREMASFHDNWLMPVITGIVVLVLVLLLYVIFRFSEKRNPTPSRTTHNTFLEVAWTAVPVLILVVLAVPSMRLLFATDYNGGSEMTLKIIGHQWYWSYEYPDHGNFTFDASMVPEEDLEPGQLRLMQTDNVVVLPVDTKVRLQFTSADVLHNWAVSDFGVRMDTVPGRLNETWVEVNQLGTYYGFCSELCGVAHSFMPITVEVVSKDDFEAWVKEAQEEFARVDDGPAPSATVAADGAPSDTAEDIVDIAQTAAPAVAQEIR